MTVVHAADGPSYRTIAEISAGEDGSVLARDADGRLRRLSDIEAQVLRHCAARTPAAQLRQRLPVSMHDLDAMESAGLLESDAAILRRCAALAVDETLPPITTLGIMTCGTPELLRRSVVSWTEFARHHGRELRVIVVDDSATPERAVAQRLTARALEMELGIELRFIDPTTRPALARELATLAGADPRLLEFAVSGCAQPRVGIGGSRNLLNLITRGRRVLSADDDIIARFAGPPHAALALWINSDDVPMHTYFFDSVADTEARVAVGLEIDAVGLHESFVGHSVANVVVRLTGPASLRDAAANLTDALQRGPVRIAATASGIAGDSASDCLGFFSLLAGGDTAARVLARSPPLSPSREVLRRPEFPVLCQGVYFITFCHAVDNRLALPPYFPVGRGEDQVWQKLLHWLAPDTVVGHLPIAVRHKPVGARRYSPDDYLDPCRVFPGNAFLLGLIGTCPQPDLSAGPDARSGVLGHYLGELAGKPGDFAAMLRAAWQAYLVHHHTLVLDSIRSRPDYPHWWRHSMRVSLERLASHMASDAEIPLEYAGRTGMVALDELRQDVLRFGRLLEAWPEIRSAADNISDRLQAQPQWLRP